MKIFHIGLCVAPEPFNELQLSFIRNSAEYREINCGDPQLNEKSVAIALDFLPDLIFMQIQAPGIITHETVQKLKETGAYVINWTGDVRNSVPQWMYDVKSDLTLFSNMRDVKEMRSKGFNSDYLEIGFNENIYCPEGIVIPTKDIVFFGNNYGPKQFPLSKFRIDMVSFLQKRYGHKFGVYGSGWPNANGNFNHSQYDEAAAYRSAKIAINCSHYEIENYSSDRLLRILGTAKPVCLSYPYPGINENISTWRTVTELTNSIDHFLTHENDRLDFVKKGFEISKEFTFDLMIKRLITLYYHNGN